MLIAALNSFFASISAARDAGDMVSKQPIEKDARPPEPYNKYSRFDPKPGPNKKRLEAEAETEIAKIAKQLISSGTDALKLRPMTDAEEAKLIAQVADAIQPLQSSAGATFNITVNVNLTVNELPMPDHFDIKTDDGDG